MKYINRLRDIMFDEYELSKLIADALELIRLRRKRVLDKQYLKVYNTRDGKIRFYSTEFKRRKK